MAKKSTLKARGIRFSDELWKRLSDDAEKKNSTPSDIVRLIIEKHYKYTDLFPTNSPIAKPPCD